MAFLQARLSFPGCSGPWSPVASCAEDIEAVAHRENTLFHCTSATACVFVYIALAHSSLSDFRDPPSFRYSVQHERLRDHKPHSHHYLRLVLRERSMLTFEKPTISPSDVDQVIHLGPKFYS